MRDGEVMKGEAGHCESGHTIEEPFGIANRFRIRGRGLLYILWGKLGS